jgi:uncharacterized pyridoxamine 5'-phosphate oxidase family protein
MEQSSKKPKGEIMDSNTIFNKIQMVDLATAEGDQPRLRPMTLIYMDKHFYFATGSNDNKTKQLQANPKAEFCMLIKNESNSGYVRGSGKMQIVTEQTLRKAVADFAVFLYDYWKDAADPDFVLFELLLSDLRYMKPGEMYEEVIPL